MRLKIIAGLLAALSAMFAAGVSCAAESMPKPAAVKPITSVTSGSKTLSVREALSIALKDNISVLNAQEEISRMSGKSRSASSVLLPQLSASGTTSGKRDNYEGDHNVSDRTAGTDLTYSIYNGGKNQAQSAQGKLGIEQASFDLYDTRETTAKSVWDAYYDVLYCQAVTNAEADAFDYYSRSVEEMTKRVAVGVSRKLDLSRVKQQKASCYASYITAKNNYDSALIALCRLLQVKPDTSIRLTDGLREELLTKGRPKEKIAIEKYFEEALGRRGDYQSLKKKLKINEKEIIVAKSGMKPELSFAGGFGYEFRDRSDDPRYSKDEWTAKLLLDIPLFDGGKSSGDTAAAKALVKQSQNNLRDKAEAIIAEITDCDLTLKSSFESAVSAKIERDYAKESLTYAEVGYKEGVNTQLDVIEARTKLTDANKVLAQYIMDFRVAQAAYWRAGGEIIERIMVDNAGEVK